MQRRVITYERIDIEASLQRDLQKKLAPHAELSLTQDMILNL